MKSLIAILMFLSQHGLSLQDFDIMTTYDGLNGEYSGKYYDDQTEKVYDCDGWVDEATILVCRDIKMIIISK